MTNINQLDDTQRIALCDLIHNAFIELRYLNGEQAHDLAYTFHNLPKEIYGSGNWNAENFRLRLVRYQTKHSSNLGFNYVFEFDKIFNTKLK